MIIEGDSHIIIQMAKRLQGGQYVVKVVDNWCMMYRVERLVELIRGHHA